MCSGGPPSRTFVYRHTPNEPPVCSRVASMSMLSASLPSGLEKRGAWLGRTTKRCCSCATTVDHADSTVRTRSRHVSGHRSIVAAPDQGPWRATRQEVMAVLLEKHRHEHGPVIGFR